ncbi:glycosyl hydrolase family 114 [Salana multivorans]|uniref:Glycosyl hydrolase family 114 n=1 Tax=Salana multivorans TaxID=120377 RepID=A0A3N2D0T2_9MICO|nr:endo alpha-1,4 polygalactosaminidase [Salana multivorans]ROR93367.1 glycosyl hydrolase family 114 [Salana multivorans]
MAVAPRVLALCGALALLSGCAASATSPRLPPATGGFDYQLGGAYEPAPDVAIVVRDSGDPVADGRYNVCYVNGFQTQPGEADSWAGLLVLDDDGEQLVDPGWPDERILDTSTAENRERIADRQARLVAHCAEAGFDAVELDNLDSYLRSDGALTPEDNLALARLLIDVAHGHGLAVAQKNAAELAERGRAAGFDLVLAEECGQYEECATYEAVYDVVLDVEYVEPAAYRAMCAAGILPERSVLRDRLLAPSGDAAHVAERCP